MSWAGFGRSSRSGHTFGAPLPSVDWDYLCLFSGCLLGLKLAFNLYTQSQHDAVLEAVLQDFLHPQFRRENKDILFVSVYGVEASGTIGDLNNRAVVVLNLLRMG
jgi:hypothetical protein